MLTLAEQFGAIDIYLFDQLLRGRIAPGMRVLDAGCGSGRNIVYFLRQGYEVFGVDADPDAIESVRQLSHWLAPKLPLANFRLGFLESMPLPDDFADVVISNAVFHFAHDTDHFEAMVRGCWRVLKPGGMLFCRLASSIGIEPLLSRLEGQRFLLPDGSERYLVDEAQLMSLTRQLSGDLLDPLKTTIVQGQRSMTTWVIQKRGDE